MMDIIEMKRTSDLQRSDQRLLQAAFMAGMRVTPWRESDGRPIYIEGPASEGRVYASAEDAYQAWWAAARKDNKDAMIDPKRSDAIAQAKARTLADYRPQHDEDCPAHKCSQCMATRDWWQHRDDITDAAGWHAFTPKPCTCGLDHLLSLVIERPREDEKELGAALLPADPSASVNTEAPPNNDKQRELAVQLIIRFARGGNEHQLSKARELLKLPPYTFPPDHRCQFCEDVVVNESVREILERAKSRIGSGNQASPKHSAAPRRSEAK